MPYSVTKQFEGARESSPVKFPKREAAEAYIQEHLQKDISYKLKTTYRLYDIFDEVLQEYTAADIQAQSSSESSGQGAGKSQSFSPTPFNMKPQPGGLPHSWVKGNEDEDKKK